MRQFHRHVLAAALFVATGAQAEAANPLLKRVVLSTGGVGYLEYEAQVEGDATLDLDVPLDQVDDVLKSLVIYDSGGTAGEITLPGREPLTQSFVDLPFERTALDSAAGLLNALQGAEIKVTAPKAISGRLLHVEAEPVQGPGGVVGSQARVSVMTDAGLQQFVLQDIDAVSFADAALQAQVTTALARIAAYRGAGRRQLTLHMHGSRARTIRIGYVVAMPLWKTSYRLSLAADPQAASARLQGWAVLENFSGQAWQDVELTLLSGNPVTFHQALYESYYVPRPNVPVEAGGRVLPPPDAGAIGAAGTAAGGMFDKSEQHAAKAMPLMRRDASNMAMAAPAAASPPPPPAAIEAGGAAEQATQIAFTAPRKISVAAGQSLVLPLLDRELPARRVDLYQPTVDGQHPLASIELTNKSDTGLPAGVLTLYQLNAPNGSLYLGDARLAGLPAGDKRLLSYAVDSKVTIDRDSSERRPIVKATIADGVMHLNRMLRWTTRYRVKAAAPASPQLLLEQPRRQGATLTAPDPKSVELTPQNYRVPLALPEAGDTAVAVSEDQPIEETLRLLDLDDNRLGAFVKSSELDPAVRRALAEIATRRQTAAQQRRDLEQLKARRAQLVEDEARLRDNLAAIGNEPALHKRLLDKFTTTETAIEELSTTTAKAGDTLAATERDLAAYIAKLTL